MKSAAAWQLGWALISVLVIYVLASGSRRTIAIAALLIMIPFQTVEFGFYGSSSVLMAYALAIILVISGGFKVRMLPALGMIVFAYLISLTQADRSIMSWHVIFMFNLFSCLIVFLIAYNFAVLVESERAIIDVLLVTDTLVVIYCMLQLTAGEGERFVPFGVESFAFNSNRGGDSRLIGPFASPGVTSTYLMMMTVLCAIELVFARGRRRWLVALLVFGNLLGLVATANRGAFLILVLVFPVLLYLFRGELGARRVVHYVIAGTAALALASTIAITYTDFGKLYERMENVSEVEDGVPAQRYGAWTPSLEKLSQSLWVGEGPLFLTPEHAERLGILRTTFDPYPHSLYLYLIRTIGVLGLVAVLWFFIQAWAIFYAGWRKESVDVYRSAILRYGVLLIPAFLIDQVRLEFIRPGWIDFTQFVFALTGLLVGVADRVGRMPATARFGQPVRLPQTNAALRAN